MKTLRQKRVRGKTRFQGIGKDAVALGVTRLHLYFVLNGDRESLSLMRRYRDLKQQQRRESGTKEKQA